MFTIFKIISTDLMITTTCCNKITSLNDLNYQWPAGFAKFSIEIVGFQKELNPDDVLKLEVILDTKLRLIWALY